MNSYEVLVYTSTKSNSLFTYESADLLVPGQVVKAPFRNTSCYGVVVKKSASYPKAKRAEALDEMHVPSYLLKACLELSQHSGIALSGIAQLLLGSFGNRRFSQIDNEIGDKLPELTAQQKTVLENINKAKGSQPMLLLGITGSGKTRVYMELIRKSLESKRSAIVLSPEVGLGSQLASEIKTYFPAQTIFVHSELTKKEREEAWSRCALASGPVIVVGPRSSLFLPVKDLGAIILDEIHDDSYKQNNDPRYHALHAASLLAKHSQATLLCGSASPNVSDYYMFKNAGYPIFELSVKARPDAHSAKVEIIDMRQEKTDKLLSALALKRIKQAHDNNHQSLVFFNRRGSSRLVMCQACGFTEKCPKCDYPLTLHRDKNQLICHSCGLVSRPRSTCPECSEALKYSVPGIKQLEAEIRELYPQATIYRFDRDSQKKDSLANSIDNIKKTPDAIIIGTQIIAKGLDLPLLESVIVVRAESALAIPDYRAEEKLYQQIHQLIGRVGRGHLKDTFVVLQTHNPDSQSLQYAANEDWKEFYSQEIKAREQLSLPPFRYLASIRIRRKTEKGVEQAAEKLLNKLNSALPNLVFIGPAPALIDKKPTYYEWTLQAFSKKRSELLKIAPLLGAQEFLDLDPTQVF